MDWWSIGNRWQARRAEAEHGQTERLVVAFAKTEGIGTSTARRCEGAVAFAHRAKAAGLLTDANQLGALPLNLVNAMQRISRFGMVEVEAVLDRFLNVPPPTRAEVGVLEAEIRVRLRAMAVGKPNAHAVRLTHGSFRKAAIEGIERWYPASTARIATPPFRNALEPFTPDAVIWRCKEQDWLAVRVLPMTAKTKVRPRVTEEFLRGVAAARVFEAVLFVVQSRLDGQEIAELIHRCGSCGLAALHLDQERGGISPLEKPARSSEPDLLPWYLEALSALFEDGPPQPFSLQAPECLGD